MIISKVYYISSLAIVVLSITSVLVASLCIWGFCLRVRGKKRKERFKKPDRRVDKSNYNKLNHSAPEEEKQDFETGSFVSTILVLNPPGCNLCKPRAG